MEKIQNLPKGVKTIFFLFFFFFFNLMLSFAQSEPWCVETTEGDYEAVEEFINSVSVSSALGGEIDIPIHVIYVYDDSGTPPSGGTRWSQVIPDANAYYEGFLNFYICGYHHIESTNYTNFSYADDRKNLFDTYHADDAINLYVVSTKTGTSAQASFPWDTIVNNGIWALPSIDGKTLAHELGHYFGLLHTQSALYLGPNNCALHPPTYDADLVPDTNYDPGPCPSYCSEDCPTISSCTLTCTSGGTVTYTYTDIPTNNLMSAHACPNKIFTSGQIDLMRTFLTSHVNRTFLSNAPDFCDNDISEDGYITKFCNPLLNIEDVGPIKDIRVQTVNQTTGYSKILKSKDDGHYEVFSNAYSNISTVSLIPQKSHPLLLIEPPSVPLNYQPLNGVTTYDLVLITDHILNIAPLGPYGIIAGDVNNSGSVTSFDKVIIRKVILGIDLDYPVGTWRFVPEHYFNDDDFVSVFETNPFAAEYEGLDYFHYMDTLTLHMDEDLVEENGPWSFRAIKVGDVNCTMTPDSFTTTDDDLITMGSPTLTCVEENDIITVDVYGSSSSNLLAYQLGLGYNTDDLQFLGVSPGTLPDFSQDNFAASSGKIKTVWLKNNGQGEDLSTPKTLFKMHFKVLNDFCDIMEELNLSTSILPSFAIDSVHGPVEATLALSYQATPPDGRLLTVSPNPSTTSVTFGFLLGTTATVEIRLSDYLGNTLQNSQQYSTGSNSYTFSSLSSLTSGALNYSVKINGVTYSGILIKS